MRQTYAYTHSCKTFTLKLYKNRSEYKRNYNIMFSFSFLSSNSFEIETKNDRAPSNRDFTSHTLYSHFNVSFLSRYNNSTPFIHLYIINRFSFSRAIRSELELKKNIRVLISYCGFSDWAGRAVVGIDVLERWMLDKIIKRNCLLFIFELNFD